MPKKDIIDKIMDKHDSDQLLFPNEKWKTVYINEKETVYMVSNYGRIRSGYVDRIIKPYKLPNDYMDIQLHIDGKIYHKLIHRLVAIAFVDNPDPENKFKVNHKDGDKSNNYDWNLEWVTNQENMDHAVETGLINNLGSKNPNSVYSEAQIHQVCMLLEDGLGPTEISKLISVDRDTIGKIKSREVWKHISSGYEVPWPAQRVYTVRPPEIREKIKTLIINGEKDYGKILLTLSLSDTRRNRRYVMGVNRSVKSKVESSTTIEPLGSSNKNDNQSS